MSSFHSLEKLSLGYLRLRNPHIIDSLLQNSQTLQVLDLFETQPSLQTIEKIVTKCDKLKEINFCFAQLKPEAIAFICNNLTPTVQKLGLSHNSVTDENIRTLVRRCHHITELDLQATGNFLSKATNLHIGWYSLFFVISWPIFQNSI